VAIGAAALGEWEAVGWLVAALAAYWVLLAIGLLLLEISVRRVVHRRGESTGKLTPLTLLKLVLAVPLTQAVYSFILFRTLRVRRVCWRGVWYDITGPWDVRRA
jgi:hypothetical protein